MSDSNGRHYKQAGSDEPSSGTRESDAQKQAAASGSYGADAAGTSAQGGSPSETMQFVAAAQRNAAQKVASSSASGDVSHSASHDASSSNVSRSAAGGASSGGASHGSPSDGAQRHASAGGSNSRSKAVYPAGGQDMSSGAQQVQPVQTGAHFAGGGSSQASGSAQRTEGARTSQQSGSAHAGGASGVAPVTPSSYTADDQNGGKRKRSKLAIVLIIIGIVLLLAAGGILIDAIMGYREAEESYDALEEYLTDDDGDGVPSVDFDALAEINPDIVGWIYIPGTEINYPVVQTTDNTTYLTKMFDDDENSNGAIFMDYEDTAPGMVDQQTTIYGHHMNDGSMFKFIDDTADQEDFDTVEVVYYITPDATYVLSPLFTTVVDETYIEARTANFTSDYLFSEYLQEMYDEASAVSDDAEDRLATTEQVLSLVTCAGDITPRTTRAVMVCAIDEVITYE